MNLNKYALIASSDFTSFKFDSIGPKGTIPKLIQFQQMNIAGYYNLAFGDLGPVTNELDDFTVSDNGDSEKVLATVVAALSDFLDSHPNAVVYATGSTKVRTRLYRMSISKYYYQEMHNFELFGEKESGFQQFELGQEYLGFLVKTKNN